MKYIKLFNESKISSDDYDSIKQYIEDISQELIDDGFQIDISYIKGKDKISILIEPLEERRVEDDGRTIIITPRDFVDFKFSLVLETLERIKHYMVSEIIGKFADISLGVRLLNNQYTSAGWDRFLYTNKERNPSIRSIRMEITIR
jgi:hypothetical protein